VPPSEEIGVLFAEFIATGSPEAKTLIRQWEAIKGHDTWARLHRIQAPTLVITGAEDALIVAENSRMLAEKIPGAQLRIIPGGGHQFLVEQAHVANEVVLAFLKGLPEKT